MDDINKEELEKNDEIETTTNNSNEKNNEFLEGVETEKFDIKTKFKNTTEEQLKNLSEKNGIYLDYSFNGEEISEGLKLFQKETIYKKNIIYTLLLSVIFFLYMVELIKNPTNMLSTCLSVVCVSLVCFIWYLPAKHLKKIAKSAEENQFEFNMTVYDSCIKIGEDSGSFVVNFNQEITKIFETSNIFIICSGKERIFVLPKRCIDSDQSRQIREIFKSKMNENFVQK